MQRAVSANQAVISFYATDPALHVFLLTRSTFQYVKIDSLALIEKETKNWLTPVEKYRKREKI
jgi:hypothetical protein